MTHGDDHGMRVPPRLAPVQAVVLAIKGDDAVLAEVRAIGAALEAAGVRVHVDDRTDVPFGRRAVDWELKGVPVRVEVGPRDLESGTAMLVRRIAGGKEPIAIGALAALVPAVLDEDQSLLLTQARVRRVPHRGRGHGGGGRGSHRGRRLGAGPVGRARRRRRGQAGRARRHRTVSGRRGRGGAGRGRDPG